MARERKVFTRQDGEDIASGVLRFVGHEYKNIVTPIIGGAQLIVRKEGLDPKLRGRIERLEEAAKRVADLAGTLKDYQLDIDKLIETERKSRKIRVGDEPADLS